MKIYLASNYITHPEMRSLALILVSMGHAVTSEWINGTDTDDWAQYWAQYAQRDLRDIDVADTVIFFSGNPKGCRKRGAKHVEFGYALGLFKRIFIVGKRQNVFHHLPGISRFTDIDALIEYLRSLPKVRYKLGIGTPGGFEFLRYVDTLEEAEKWASTPAECKGTTNVYEEVGGGGTKE